MLFSLRRLRTQRQGSLRVCGYNYLTEANFRSSYSLFKSLHRRPRIKSKVLSLVFMTLHNQATTYLSSSIALKVNYFLPPVNLFPAYAVPSALYAHYRFSFQSHLPQLHRISHLRTLQGTLTRSCTHLESHLLSEVFLSSHSGFFPLNFRALLRHKKQRFQPPAESNSSLPAAYPPFTCLLTLSSQPLLPIPLLQIACP